MRTTIVWFRLDLRLQDHPALHAAVDSGNFVLPVYIDASPCEGKWKPGAASRWWLHYSLKSLQGSLRDIGSDLFVYRGDPEDILSRLAQEYSAGAVYWGRRYEPEWIFKDRNIQTALNQKGIRVEIFNTALIREPVEIQNRQGQPYKVFTPFWKCLSAEISKFEILPAPKKMALPSPKPKGLGLSKLGLLPEIDWAEGMRQTWLPGEQGARRAVRKFLKSIAGSYDTSRNYPGKQGTSRISPHLHFGEISVREVWNQGMALRSASREEAARKSCETFLREIGWREFSYHLLYHFPRMIRKPLQKAFEKFPWAKNPKALKLWQKGRTGYPIVDAGMRELWRTGWMHNRVRMIAASFLVKDLRVHWLMGAEWFWDTLVDADLANNTQGWQWTAGCGADAAPYFRIFNPVFQGEKFDPDGIYVRKWIPELAKLPTRWIHKPWLAPPEILSSAGVRIGKNYPAPIADHGDARKAALTAYFKLQEAGQS